MPRISLRRWPTKFSCVLPLAVAACGTSEPSPTPALSLDFSEFATPREGVARVPVRGPQGAATPRARVAAPSAPKAEPAVVGTSPAEATLAELNSAETPAPAQGGASNAALGQASALARSGSGVGATVIAATVYRQPDINAERLGYVRLGGILARTAETRRGGGCKGDWYAVSPYGFQCGDEVTADLNHPLVRAASRRPDLSRPLPYAYGFVRATAPQYLRVPTRAEQQKSEFKLDEHLKWYEDNYLEVQRPELGANDVPLDAHGYARPGIEPGPGFRLSSQLSATELLGGNSATGEIPFWLKEGRGVPNVSAFQVPDYALFADRVRRKTGLSFIDSFVVSDEGVSRRFSVTVDLRLIPATKVKPETGSRFHGIELGSETQLPLAFVTHKSAHTYKLIKDKDEARPDETLPFRAVVPLTGNARIKASQRYFQLSRAPQRWLAAPEIAVVSEPPDFPPEADKGQKWIDVSLVRQTLVLYEGRKPVYATLVSTGRDGTGDPKTTLSTPQGSFRIRSKHVAAAMDSEENSSLAGGTRAAAAPTKASNDAAATVARLKKAQASGEKLSEDDKIRLKNIEKGRDPEYGVTTRRGSGGFELRDVPWIQYFAAGYALHGAYWHDVFGTPRSHGCINLAPIDARYVFFWTTPTLPEGWHGVNAHDAVGEGTLVRIRE